MMMSGKATFWAGGERCIQTEKMLRDVTLDYHQWCDDIVNDLTWVDSLATGIDLKA